jgi:hypothetical protein
MSETKPVLVTEVDVSSADVLQAMRDGLSPAEFDRQCQDRAWRAAIAEQVARLGRLTMMRSWDAGEVYSASSVDDIASELNDLLATREDSK